jgi:hypothetical protein
VIPRRARLADAQPAPIVQGDRVIWHIDTLLPGREARFRVEIQPLGPGEMISGATVTVNSARVRTLVGDPGVTPGLLTLNLKGPTRARVGQAAELSLSMTNNSSRSLTGLMLRVQLSPGLDSSWGHDVEAPLEDLPPGSTKVLKLPVRASKPGRQVADAVVMAGTVLQAGGQLTVEVGANSALPGFTGKQP